MYKEPVKHSRLTLRLRLSISVHLLPLPTLTRSSPCASHSLLSSSLASPAPSVGSRKYNHPRKGLLWFLRSLEAFLDLARNGQALSNKRPRILSLPG
ncbi:hypothetical protein ARMGADRAFT_299947 [Armillaria gallica]|uniref:Uncharacterized protein n=1 Tax=Armillaria gallica TaxID=47427 RepID=A0A2H3D8X7_ARMGA|nr:hypothetical protein ARMGADRAFT_299947 [Armillaria gallica]